MVVNGNQVCVLAVRLTHLLGRVVTLLGGVVRDDLVAGTDALQLHEIHGTKSCGKRRYSQSVKLVWQRLNEKYLH